MGLQAYFEVNLYSKMAIPESQRYPWKLDVINNEEDIVVFLG